MFKVLAFFTLEYLIGTDDTITIRLGYTYCRIANRRAMSTLTAKPTAGYPSLPQELIDMIIDHLAAERRPTRDPNRGQWYSPTPSLF